MVDTMAAGGHSVILPIASTTINAGSTNTGGYLGVLDSRELLYHLL